MENNDAPDYFEKLAREAASDLLEQHGLNDGSGDPLVEFAWELGESGRSSQNWTYENGLEALVREAVLLDRDNR